MTKRPARIRRKGAAVLAGLIATTVIGASAASLGGLNSDDLGADTGTVGSCDTNGIDVEYRTAYNRGLGGYRVNRVVLRDVSADCIGLPYSITLAEAGPTGASVTASGPALDIRNINDTDPGPGIELAGISRITVRMLVQDVDRIAITIGGVPIP